jgi:hypothetical protein
MTLWIIVIGWMTALTGVSAAVFSRLRGTMYRVRQLEIRQRQELAPLPEPVIEIPTVEVLSEDVLLAPPPTVHGDTVRDWLTHYSYGEGVTWPEVVKRFYTAASRDPEIFDYFRNLNMVKLQSHFAGAMKTVTSDGVYQSTVDAMRVAHVHVRNSRGEPITDAIFDRTVATLGMVLFDVGVSEVVLHRLQETVEPLRAAIVQQVAA